MALSISPSLVLAVAVILLATQLMRVLAPAVAGGWRTPILAALGFIMGEVIAQGGHLASPTLGAVHPLADACAIGILEILGVIAWRTSEA